MTTTDSQSLWSGYVDAHAALVRARMALVSQSPDLVDTLRHGLHEPAERAAALDVARLLPEDRRKQLLPELLALASFAHGLTEESIAVMRSLPRSWVVSVIEAFAEPLLRTDDHEAYRGLLRVYGEFDVELARRLALRAQHHPDPDVREAGADWLERAR